MTQKKKSQMFSVSVLHFRKIQEKSTNEVLLAHTLHHQQSHYRFTKKRITQAYNALLSWSPILKHGKWLTGRKVILIFIILKFKKKERKRKLPGQKR
jgi:hypothetical protein